MAATWWAAGFVVVTMVGLVALDWAVLTMHALVYGMSQVLDPEAIAAPATDRYVRALVVGGIVNVAATAGMLWLTMSTGARQWPAWTFALSAAAAGGAVGASALLLVLGINPLDVLVDGWR